MADKQTTEKRSPRWSGRLFLLAIVVAAGAAAARHFIPDEGSLEKILPYLSEGGVTFMLGMAMGKASQSVLKWILFLMFIGWIVLLYLGYSGDVDLGLPVLRDVVNVTPTGGAREVVQERVPMAGVWILGYLLGLVK